MLGTIFSGVCGAPVSISNSGIENAVLHMTDKYTSSIIAGPLHPLWSEYALLHSWLLDKLQFQRQEMALLELDALVDFPLMKLFEMFL